MDSYLIPIKYALFTFPIVAAILTVPYLILQYRKYGYVNKLRSFVLFSFLLYCISAYYLVMLPMPKDTSNCVREGALMSYMQLQPFMFVEDITRETGFNWRVSDSYFQMFKHPAFLQVLFNLLLTMPLGVYLRYYFRRSFWQTFTLAACMSLFFEITQLTGLYGVYDCPYRLFDVDDLLTNTLGGMIGFGLAPLITYFLPRSEELDKNVELEKMTVGYVRRAIAYSIDVVCMMLLTPIILPIQAGVVQLSSSVGIDLAGWEQLIQSIAAASFIVFLYWIVLPTFTGGRTFGKMVTRIHVIEDKRRGQPREITIVGLFKRYGLLYYVGLGSFTFAIMMGLYMDLPSFAHWMALGISFIIVGAFAIHVLLRLFSRDKLLFYERLSGTRNVISITKRVGDPNGDIASNVDCETHEADVSEYIGDEGNVSDVNVPVDTVEAIADKYSIDDKQTKERDFSVQEEADSKAMREMMELRQSIVERKAKDQADSLNPLAVTAEFQMDDLKLMPSEQQSEEAELMSASTPPMPEAIDRELERLRAKIKQRDQS